jgi:hypothetical protein
LALLVVANPVLVIGSATDCPGTAQILSQIVPLLPAGMTARETGAAGTDENDRGEVTLVAGMRWVRLRSQEERFNHERAIPSSLSCAEAAQAAAVLLAAWEFQGRAELPPLAGSPMGAPSPQPADATITPKRVPDAEPSGPPASGPAPPRGREPLPDPAGPVRPAVGAAGASPPSGPPATTVAVAPPARTTPLPTLVATEPAGAAATRAPRRLGVGGGISGARAVDRFVVGATAEVVLGPPVGSGLRLQGGTASGYSVAIGTGRANWTRTTLGFGPSLTGRRGRLGFQAHGELVGAVLSISGAGFNPDAKGTQLVGGGAVGGRGLVSLGGGDLWLDVTLTAWTGQHEVVLRDGTNARNLPSAELNAALGIDFYLWP